ncbi:conserved exported protein of unknown function [Shewanella benthica]|uniref:YD repeat protein n=1 Tax=Shewanella benthica TaxID=43661 RepID=A0A330M4S8_9GAMM|nr:hypothetical protein [Shewanella benthica]SQH77281.1 conserved exported protein of unknown function [Shewanella benthica]
MKLNKGLFFTALLIATSGSNAQDIVIPKETGYNFLEVNNVNPNISTLTTDLFGDQIDYNTGSVNFTQTDIELQGNFNIPVRLTRRLSDPDSWYKESLEMGTWSVDIPHVRSAFISRNGDHKNAYWAEGLACSKPLNTNEDFYTTTWNGVTGKHLTYVASRQQYWNGDSIYIPGHGSTKITQKDGAKTNNKQWKIECLSNSSNEGFKVTLTNGHTYYFEKYRAVKSNKKILPTPIVNSRDQCTRHCAAPTIDDGEPSIPHVEYDYYSAFLLATKITDVHGNWVKYSYNPEGIVNKIYSSDGREINFTIENDRIKTATANNQTWDYHYDGLLPLFLDRVTKPDRKYWLFDYNQTSGDSVFHKLNLGYHTQYPVPGYACTAGLTHQRLFVEQRHAFKQVILI